MSRQTWELWIINQLWKEDKEIRRIKRIEMIFWVRHLGQKGTCKTTLMNSYFKGFIHFYSFIYSSQYQCTLLNRNKEKSKIPKEIFFKNILKSKKVSMESVI